MDPEHVDLSMSALQCEGTERQVQVALTLARTSAKHAKLAVESHDGLEYIPTGDGAMCFSDRIITMYPEDNTIYSFDKTTLLFRRSFTTQGSDPRFVQTSDQASVITWDATNQAVIVYQMRLENGEMRLSCFAISSDEAASVMHTMLVDPPYVKFDVVIGGERRTCNLFPNEGHILAKDAESTACRRDETKVTEFVSASESVGASKSAATNDPRPAASDRDGADRSGVSSSAVDVYYRIERATEMTSGRYQLRHIRWQSTGKPDKGDYFKLTCLGGKHASLDFEELLNTEMMSSGNSSEEWIMCFARPRALYFPTVTSKLFMAISAVLIPDLAGLVLSYLFPGSSECTQADIHGDRLWKNQCGRLSYVNMYDGTTSPEHTIPAKTVRIAGFDNAGRPVVCGW
jgi:hypothetical protein